MNIALVYDRVNKWGGAERVLLALHEIWPQAPLYTAVYNRNTARWADGFRVVPSFLNRIPFARSNHEFLAALTPMAFESFNFDRYDVVLSVTSAEAKTIITKPGTLHICYCLTPTRYLWSGREEYTKGVDGSLTGNLSAKILSGLMTVLQRWDKLSAHRPDTFIAISQTVRKRIERYYHLPADKVIYPPVDVDQFENKNSVTITKGSYYLTVSRHVGYKRVDIVIDAFNRLGWPLVVIGNGRQHGQLKRIAGGNVRFIDTHLTDTELADYYKHCRAFVHAGAEDFGITAVEAQAAGKPVFTYRHSGMAETVIEGKTGDFFDVQSPESLADLLTRTSLSVYDPAHCRKNAQRFSTAEFKKNMVSYVQETVRARRNSL
jgi:glycosyltransferase involved in cell wall biosynthesis